MRPVALRSSSSTRARHRQRNGRWPSTWHSKPYYAPDATARQNIGRQPPRTIALDRLHNTVLRRDGADTKSIPNPLNRLVMTRVDQQTEFAGLGDRFPLIHALRHQGSRAHDRGMRHRNTGARRVIHRNAAQVLYQAPPLQHVDRLRPVADAQNRLSSRRRLLQQYPVDRLALQIGRSTLGNGLLCIAPRIDVSRASWKQNPVTTPPNRR